MNHFPVPKFIPISAAKAISDNAAVTTLSMDLRGANYAIITVYFGVMDIAMAVLKLQHSDTDSNYADITGSDLASLAVDTADGKAIRYFLKPSKRYCDLVMTTGDGSAGTYLSAHCDAFYDELPSDDTERGLLASAFLAP